MGSLPLRYPDLENQVEVRCPEGHPLVLAVHPVRFTGERPHPFPTLFWLSCPEVHRQIARLETRGFVDELERRLKGDDALAARVAADHRAYIEERLSHLRGGEREALERHGLLADFARRGVGGVTVFTSVKCLHLHYAHHLARGTTLGPIIEEAAGIALCGAREAAS